MNVLFENLNMGVMKVINQGSKLKPLGKDRKNEQDNTSAIQLEHNDWKSRSNRQTKHFGQSINFVPISTCFYTKKYRYNACSILLFLPIIPRKIEQKKVKILKYTK